jgi:hypothetical protein
MNMSPFLKRFAEKKDLGKINSFRTRFQREKATVDAQLKSGIRAQLEITQVEIRALVVLTGQDGLESLNLGQKDITGVREEIAKV